MDRQDWLDAPECNTGWKRLLGELDTRLREQWPDYAIAQIKEKFGTLRFYADTGLPVPAADDTAQYAQWKASTDAFYALISEYEARSGSICEICGSPGKLGDRNGWWATRCPGCAPAGWVAEDVECDHPRITDNACDSCGRTALARLEHSDVVLHRVHHRDHCRGERCTLHKLSDHPMRSFPQHWRSDRGLMERICPHGIGHPDPDDVLLTGEAGQAEAVHGCDGCCSGAR